LPFSAPRVLSSAISSEFFGGQLSCLNYKPLTDALSTWQLKPIKDALEASCRDLKSPKCHGIQLLSKLESAGPKAQNSTSLHDKQVLTPFGVRSEGSRIIL